MLYSKFHLLLRGAWVKITLLKHGRIHTEDFDEKESVESYGSEENNEHERRLRRVTSKNFRSATRLETEYLLGRICYCPDRLNRFIYRRGYCRLVDATSRFCPDRAINRWDRRDRLSLIQVPYTTAPSLPDAPRCCT